MPREAIEIIEANGRTAHIYYDDHAQSPLDWRSGDTGEPVIYHSSTQYTLGHERASSDAIEEMASDRAYYCAPVYTYVHGGATISLGQYSCPWDSGCSGIIAVYKTDYARMIGHKRWNGATAKRARADFATAVEEFDQYLTGDVYGYVIEDGDGEYLDSCWSFYSLKWVREEARAALEAMRPPAPSVGDVEATLGAHVA